MKRWVPWLIVAVVVVLALADGFLPLARPVAEEVQVELNALRQENLELRSALKVLAQVSDLVRIQDIDASIIVELRYASGNNLTGRPVYPAPVALLQRETALKLAAANAQLKERGFRLKVWDAYRPYHIHQMLWEAAGDKRHFFADPRYGSIHNRAAAVDVTLVDSTGKPVEMPTDFDDFTGRAHRNHPEMSQASRENLDLLTEVMAESGFTYIDFEWWHFVDTEWWRYPILDLPLEPYGELPDLLR